VSAFPVQETVLPLFAVFVLSPVHENGVVAHVAVTGTWQQVVASHVDAFPVQGTVLPLFTVFVVSPVHENVAHVAATGASQQVVASHVDALPVQETVLPLFSVFVVSPVHENGVVAHVAAWQQLSTAHTLLRQVTEAALALIGLSVVQEVKLSHVAVTASQQVVSSSPPSTHGSAAHLSEPGLDFSWFPALQAVLTQVAFAVAVAQVSTPSTSLQAPPVHSPLFVAAATVQFSPFERVALPAAAASDRNPQKRMRQILALPETIASQPLTGGLLTHENPGAGPPNNHF